MPLIVISMGRRRPSRHPIAWGRGHDYHESKLRTLQKQPELILDFAKRGFATVVALSLKSSEAVKLAVAQVEELFSSEVPVLLFLGRVRKLEVDIAGAGVIRRRHTLTREVRENEGTVAGIKNCRIQTVTLGPGRKRWLCARRIVDHDRVLAAVRRSLTQESSPDPNLLDKRRSEEKKAKVEQRALEAVTRRIAQD